MSATTEASAPTVASVLAAARAQGVALTAERDEFDKSGLDFLVVHARDAQGAAWVVRTPRRPDVLGPARIEARVLALVAPKLPVAVPEWRVFSPEVIAYPRVVGTPVVTVDPERGPVWNVIDPKAPSETFIESFARTLAALQALTPDARRDGAIPEKPVRAVRDELALWMDQTREVLAPSDAVWRRWHAWLANDALWPEHTALVHGDLHPGHMLVADDGRLVGVLDWTEASVTDPVTDFAMFHGCFGRDSLAQLAERFERAGGARWPGMLEHAAERWASFAAAGAAWAIRTNNPGVLDHVRAQLAAITEETTPG